MAEIVYQRDGLNVSQVTLGPGETTIGRDPRCHIALAHSSVSRRHARIVRHDRDWVVEDLGSANGTRVNGQRITSRELAPGDRIQVGEQVLLFTEDPSGLVPFAPEHVPLEQADPVLPVDQAATGNLPVIEARGEADEARLLDQSMVFDVDPSDLQNILMGVAPGADAPERARDAGAERLQALFDISQTIEAGRDFHAVLGSIMDKAITIMGAERGFLMLEDPGTGKLRVQVARDQKGDASGVEAESISRTILKKVRETGKPVVIVDTRSGEWSTQSILDSQIHSALCAPLLTRGSVTGVLYVDHRSKPLMFTKEDVAFFTTFAYQAKAVIDNSRAYWDLVESLFKASDDFIVVCSPLGKINLVNRSGCETLGMSMAEITTKNIADLAVAEDRPKAEQLVKDTLRSGVASGREIEFEPQDGHPVPMSVSSFALRDRAGTASGLCLIGRDLSAQRFLIRQLERRNKFIQKTFGRYLSDDIVENILESHEGMALGGEKRKVTILMSDLRGFTALAEQLPPEQVVTILNNYLGTMAEIILKYNGTIDEFIGDAVLAIFGAPVKRDDDTVRAAACATAMQLAMEGVNRRNAAEGLPLIDMGIGLNTGEVVVGNIGSHKRAKYGVVGSTVNTTSRIESFTIGGQILISEATLMDAGDVLHIGRRLTVAAKGNKEPLAVYELLGLGEPFHLTLPERKETYVTLGEALPLEFTVLSGKSIGDTLHPGRILRLSERAAEVESKGEVATLDNVKLTLFDREGKPISKDIYAKVIEREGEGAPRFQIRFTSLPREAAAYLEQARKRG